MIQIGPLDGKDRIGLAAAYPDSAFSGKPVFRLVRDDPVVCECRSAEVSALFGLHSQCVFSDFSGCIAADTPLIRWNIQTAGSDPAYRYGLLFPVIFENRAGKLCLGKDSFLNSKGKALRSGIIAFSFYDHTCAARVNVVLPCLYIIDTFNQYSIAISYSHTRSPGSSVIYECRFIGSIPIRQLFHSAEIYGSSDLQTLPVLFRLQDSFYGKLP